MAPEQILGHARRASDQYALGVVVYEWLTGSRPFSGGTSEEIARQHLHAPAPSLRQRIPSLSPAIEQVILKALEKQPGARFPNVQEFALALEQAALTS
jgi:serine/threonine protein kinase